MEIDICFASLPLWIFLWVRCWEEIFISWPVSRLWLHSKQNTVSDQRRGLSRVKHRESLWVAEICKTSKKIKRLKFLLWSMLRDENLLHEANIDIGENILCQPCQEMAAVIFLISLMIICLSRLPLYIYKVRQKKYFVLLEHWAFHYTNVYLNPN